MDIVLSSSSDKPIYLQIYEQIANQILRSEIAAGSQLPPIRTVAKNLHISVIPVKQAWENLDRDGFITTAAGRGTFVAQLKHHEINTKRNNAAEQLITRGVDACKALGFSCNEIISLIQKVYKK
jgi:GntR family transcriptional regulator